MISPHTGYETDFDIKWMIYYLWELILRWLNSITNCVSKFPGLSSHLKLSLKSLCLLPASPGLSLSGAQPRGSSLSWAQAPGPAPVTRGSITSRGPSTISCSRPGVWTVAGCRFLRIKQSSVKSKSISKSKVFSLLISTQIFDTINIYLIKKKYFITNSVS